MRTQIFSRRLRRLLFTGLLSAACVSITPQGITAQGIDPAAFLHRPEVSLYVEYFTTGERKKWLEATFERGIIYADYISAKITEYSLPEALKYLPVIESGFNPSAVSPSGAAGLWQFMMNSIAPFDLRVNEWVDERRDFWKSTAASLEKLKYNEAILGDWLLAIAAYNCGLNRMKQAIEESESRDFWELAANDYLPGETKRYVPKFLAIAYIAGNHESYGVEMPSPTGWNWLRIPVKGQVNLKLLAETAGIPVGILTLGNAELEYDVTPPREYPYHLKVPDIYSDVIDKTLKGDALTLNRFYVHNIESGDTLYALAGHFGVPIDLIMYNNPGIEPRLLKINSSLLIPAFKEVPPFPRPSVSREGTLRASGYRSGRYSLPLHTVVKGETLWGIARKYSTTIKDLLSANAVTADSPIRPGQILNIPVEGGELLRW
jgi:membrane-bound lytic murein transglycosylase D